MAASKKSGTGPASSASAPKVSKIRAGMGDVASESVEVWTDEDEARARGFFQLLDEDGNLKVTAPRLDGELLRGVFRSMLRIRLLDEKMMTLQRQGRIGFYADARGQEASVVASAAALAPEDYIVPSHREAGAALHRGLPLRTFLAQVLGNAHDIAKGRQMPVHTASPRALSYLPMSSVVATQLPHAMGIAWAAKLQRKNTVVLAYLGEGATSADDFHAGVNFAAVFKVPVVFLCENNGWAISTRPNVQTHADTFALKALAYGLPGVRIDGNDALAVHATTSEAVARARAGEGPTLIEAVTYRLGAHSSSDDPTRYRNEEELATWTRRDPLVRLRKHLAKAGDVAEDEAQRWEAEIQGEIEAALAAEEGVPPPALETLFDDVYATVPAHLAEQRDELLRIRGK